MHHLLKPGVVRSSPDDGFALGFLDHPFGFLGFFHPYRLCIRKKSDDVPESPPLDIPRMEGGKFLAQLIFNSEKYLMEGGLIVLPLI